MIKLTSFYPFAGFVRVTQEFHDDKFVTKTKSPTYENEAEFPYSKIAQISDAHYSSGGQMQFAFFVLMIIGLALMLYCSIVYSNTTLLRVVQVVYICGVFLLVTSFIRDWYIFITNEDGEVITTIKINDKNRESTYKAIDLILSKSETTTYITTTDPFPDAKSAFVHSYIGNSIADKTIDGFYDEEIVGHQKTLFGERAYVVRYSGLSGEVIRKKIGIKVWDSIFSISVLIISILVGSIRGFNFLSEKVFIYSAIALFSLTVLSISLAFVKRDVVELPGKNGKPGYWAYVNRSDREKFEEIIEFVQSSITAEKKETTRKEQE